MSELSKEEGKKKGADAEAPAAQRMRPVVAHDNQLWWDRINEGELPIQRCKQMMLGAYFTHADLIRQEATRVFMRTK